MIEMCLVTSNFDSTPRWEECDDPECLRLGIDGKFQGYEGSFNTTYWRDIGNGRYCLARKAY